MRKALWLVLLTPAVPALAVTGSLRPVNNTFVLRPGVASSFPDAGDLNFGGSGSLCVSSASARACDANDGIDHLPKGEFVTLLKFDSSPCAGTVLSAMTLKLAITNGNQSAKGIFNYLGGPGNFDLYWISSDWQQGYGTPNVAVGAEIGITYAGLIDLLDQIPPAYLETLYYDARYAYADGENWFVFELDLESESYAGLVQAIENGETITVMLAPSEGSDVCFDIRAYAQEHADGTHTVRDNGPFLEVKTALPFRDVDFDGSGVLDHADLGCIVDHWQQTGDALTGDIAPLGGDGVIDMLDLTEFMAHWPAFEASGPVTD